MKEIAVISGKGGTGKTSLTSSFATLAQNLVLVDCDVDAADLHLVMKPEAEESHEFISGNEAVINSELCSGCGACYEYCRFDAIKADGDNLYAVDPASCEGCGLCVKVCPLDAIDFPDRKCGDWFKSNFRYGKLIHAKLAIAAENSGKLVSAVRKEARMVASSIDAKLILIDGPPGIGCPVIASITGADAVVVVTEPTLSGIHDLKRTIKLTKHFHIPSYVCVNKWDINPDKTDDIEQFCKESGCAFLGKVSYSNKFTEAQIKSQSIIEYGGGRQAEEVKAIWDLLCQKVQLF